MQKAIIIGAGPAGLTAAFELCDRTALQPVVLERSRHGRDLGAVKTVRIGCSYMLSTPRKRPERSIEDFFINRFGRELYLTFDSADWGAQRIKGLSILQNACARRETLATPNAGEHFAKNTETSLIERFLYPKFGPGQMWDQGTTRSGTSRMAT